MAWRSSRSVMYLSASVTGEREPFPGSRSRLDLAPRHAGLGLEVTPSACCRNEEKLP